MSSRSVPLPVRGDLFAGRYRIERALGEGGMGRVYEAHDTRLDERVALKLLSFAAADDEHMARFQKEVRLARRITHPNVARTHDIGDADGSPFLTMELIDGQSLDDLIDARLEHAGPREGPLAPDEAVEVAIPMALGLEAAHRAGVVHRDLKPANVMIETREGALARVVITDFGVARAVDGAEKQTSGVLGTPIYMAPEQIVGEEVGPFSDIYSLGVVLYEMLTGRLPFTGATPMAVALARCRVSPTDPREHVELNASLAEIVLRCLDHDPQRRPRDAADVADRLRRHARAASAHTVMVTPSQPAPGASTSISSPFAPMSPGKRTLAVLPFAYRGPAELDFVGESLAQELIDTLSRTRGLRVLGYGATGRYAAEGNADPREIGRALGADVIVSANLQASADRVRVSARLTDVHSGVQLWSERFDKRFEDVFEMQDVVSKQVADALRVELTVIEHQWHATAEASELYLRARRSLEGRFATGGREAVALLDRCLELSPQFAPAYAARAIAAVKAWWVDIMGTEATEWHERSKTFVAEALEHADELAETHLAAAIYALQIGELRETASRLATALTIAPTLAEAHRYLADLQCEAGRLEEGMRRAKLALELDPSNTPARFCLVRHHGLMGRWDDARAELNALEDALGTHHSALLMMRMRLCLWEGGGDSVAPLIEHVAASKDPLQQMMAGFIRYTRGELDDTVLDATLMFSKSFGNARLSSLIGQLVTEAYASRGETVMAVRTLVATADDALVDVAWMERCPLLGDVRATSEAAGALSKVRNRANAIWEIKPY